MGHGHVRPNADGSLARCGGPRVCSVCALELAGFIEDQRGGDINKNPNPPPVGPAPSVQTKPVSYETFQRFGIGEFVQMACPPERVKERYAYGRIMAEEKYRDDHGTRVWVYVQWLAGDGKPDSSLTKHAPCELELFTK